MRNDFIFCSGDTDGLKFLKPDGSPFTKEERKEILDHLNSQMPECLVLEDDGYYESFVVLKTKNYIYSKEGKVTFKGSSMTSGSKEPALLEMIEKIGLSLLNGINYPELEKIYLSYVKETQNVTDITRWAVKKTVTKPVLESENDPEARTNELKVLRAIKHLNPQEGDKVYVYDAIDGMVQAVVKGEPVFLKDGSPKMIQNKILKTVDQYDNDYIPAKLVKRVFDTICIFDTIFTPKVEIHVAKKDLNNFRDHSIVNFLEYHQKLLLGQKLTLDLLDEEVVFFVKYIKRFPEVKIKEISRFKGLVEVEEEE